MRAPRLDAGPLFLLLAAPLLFGGVAGCGRGSAPPPAVTAASENSVAARPREQVRIWTERTEQDPAGATNWSRLGHAQVALARSTSDESIYGEAAAAFRRSLALQPRNNPSARGGLARTLLARHEFAAASEEAEEALRECPGDNWLLGMIGDAAMELGDYARARSACDALLGAEVTPGALARRAQLAELAGDRRAALVDYGRALEACRNDELETRAWLHCQVGDVHLRHGATDDARRAYERALALAPDYPVARQRLADAYEWSGRFADAAPLLRDALRGTRAPELVLRLAAVEEALGHAVTADSLRLEARAHMEHHYLTGEMGHVRTLARTLMDRPGRPSDLARALELALADLEARGGIYAEWTAARALRLNGRPREALAHANRSVALGTPEADFWLERAACLDDLGRAKEAAESRDVARRMNPLAKARFHPGPVTPRAPASATHPIS